MVYCRGLIFGSRSNLVYCNLWFGWRVFLGLMVDGGLFGDYVNYKFVFLEVILYCDWFNLLLFGVLEVCLIE